MLAKIIHAIAAELQGPPASYSRRPSSAGPERCVRAMVYHANGTEAQPFAGRAMMVFDDSSWHVELTNDWLRKTAYHLHSEEMEIATPVGAGHIDGILTDPIGVDRLYEHKAINHFTFERIWGGDWPLDYLTQCALYLTGLQAINPDISECLLLVKNKNTSAYIDFILRYDTATDSLSVVSAERSDGKSYAPDFVMQRVTQAAVEKFDLVDRHVAAGTLPERPFPYDTDFPCGYCRWGKMCWQSYEQEFGELATGTELPQEIADKVRYYRELGATKSALTKEHEALRDAIKQTLTAAGVRSGSAGEYLIELQLRQIKKLNPEKLSGAIRTSATETTLQERLVIKNRNQEEHHHA